MLCPQANSSGEKIVPVDSTDRSGWSGRLGFSESPPGHRFTEFTPGIATDRGEPADGVVWGLLKFLWVVPADLEE